MRQAGFASLFLLALIALPARAEDGQPAPEPAAGPAAFGPFADPAPATGPPRPLGLLAGLPTIPVRAIVPPEERRAAPESDGGAVARP
jgi:hypothetical protein